MGKPNPKNIAYKNQFNSERYDRMNIMVPKGKKDAIAAFARDVRGCNSTNSYVTGLIQTDMGLTDEEWQESGKEQGETP